MVIVYSRAGAGAICGIACGPVGMDQASAEIYFRDNEVAKWISVNWQSEFPEGLQVNITDTSVFKYFSGIEECDEEGKRITFDDEDFDPGDVYCFEEVSEYDGPYAELLPRLLKLLYTVLESNDFVSADRFTYKEDIWPWLTDIGVTYDIPTEEEDQERIKEEYGLASDLPILSYDEAIVELRGNHIISFKRGKDRIYNAGLIIHLPDGDFYLHEEIDWNGKKEFSVAHPDLDPMDAYRKAISEYDPDPNYDAFHRVYWDHHFEVFMSEDEAMNTRYREYFRKIDSFIRDREEEIVFD